MKRSLVSRCSERGVRFSRRPKQMFSRTVSQGKSV